MYTQLLHTFAAMVHSHSENSLNYCGINFDIELIVEKKLKIYYNLLGEDIRW